MLRIPLGSRTVALAILLSAALICAVAPNPPLQCVPSSAMRQQIVTFGDSLTQRGFEPGGWTSRLANAYIRKADVINRGYGGYNTRWALQILPHVLPPQNPPMLAVLFFGANDAALPDLASAKQHVPVEEFKANLEAMIEHLHRLKVTSTVLIAPPPVHETGRLQYAAQLPDVLPMEQPERSNEVTGKYAEAVVELGRSAKLPVVNLWTAMQQVPGWQTKLFEDGLHFTPEGQELLYSMLQQTIDDTFRALKPDVLPFDFPHHSEIVAAADPLSVFQSLKA